MIFFVTIIASYGTISEVIDHGFTFKELGLFMIVFYCLAILYIICNEAHYANLKVGYMFQQILFNVNTVGLTQNAKKELQMFIMAIQKNPPIMSLNGYVTVDRGLVSSVSFFDCSNERKTTLMPYLYLELNFYHHILDCLNAI